MPTRSDPWPPGTPCWVEAVTDDLATTIRFYSELLGWDVDATPDATGRHYATKNGHPVAAVMATTPQRPAVGWTTYIAGADLAAGAAEVTRRGGRVVAEPTRFGDRGSAVVLADPAGAEFGIWQAGAQVGSTLYNEPGAYCWNDLHTADYDAAREFYASVFGYEYKEIGDGVHFAYSMFLVDGSGEGVGGMHRTGADEPPYWLTWFTVADTDTAVQAATELGATVVIGPTDSPFGRMSLLLGTRQERFVLLDPRTVSDTLTDPTAR